MKIVKNTVVTVEYELSDAHSGLIEKGGPPIVYLHGGYENTLLKIEQALDGKEAGYTVLLNLAPDDAYGMRDPALVKTEPRSRLPSPLEIGMQFEGIPHGDDDGEGIVLFTVTDITQDTVVLDGNHPLAGKSLRYALRVTGVRQATNDEIAHKHAHGEHSHQHDDMG